MITRRELLRKLGVGAAVAPFLGNLPSFANAAAARQRLVIVFSPDGTVQENFWPTAAGSFTGPEGDAETAVELRPILARWRV